jgi:hypothetical protein
MKKLRDVAELTYDFDMTRCLRLHFDEYDRVKDAWMRGDVFIETKDDCNEPCVIKLTGLLAIVQRPSEARMQDIEESLLVEKLNNDAIL